MLTTPARSARTTTSRCSPRRPSRGSLSDEGFFPDGSFLNLFRLRAAYGESGLYPGNLDALVYLSPTTAAINGISSSAVTIGGLGLSTLKPEHAREIEVGADMGLWGDRVSLEATYYNKQSRDALISRVLAPSHGIVTSRFENLGQVTQQRLRAGPLHPADPRW